MITASPPVIRMPFRPPSILSSTSLKKGIWKATDVNMLKIIDMAVNDVFFLSDFIIFG